MPSKFMVTTGIRGCYKGYPPHNQLHSTAGWHNFRYIGMGLLAPDVFFNLLT